MNVEPDGEIVAAYKKVGGKSPLYGKVTGVFAQTREEGLKLAKERWPNNALGGTLTQDLALPRDFEAATETVREEDLADGLALGREPGPWREAIDAYRRAGFTHVALHDISDDQAGFIEFAQQFVES